MKKFWAALVIYAAAFILAQAFAAPQEASSQQLKVGMLLSLSGNFASAGEDCRLGVVAGQSVADPNKKLEIVYGDSKNEPSSGVSELKKLIEVEKVLGVFTHRSAIGMAINPISQRLHLPLLGSVGHKDFAKNNSYAIQFWPRSDDEGHFYAEEFLRRGYKTAAMIYSEDEWTSTVSQGFREKYLERGGKLEYDQPALPSDTDFRTQLTQIKLKKPEVVYMNMLLPQVAPILKQARELNVGGEFYFNFYVSKKDVVEAAGNAALENVHFVELDTDLPKLKETLKLSEAQSPPGLTVSSYVATILLFQVVSENREIKNSEELMKALVSQKEVRTPDYTYPIENRYVRFPLAVKVMHNGKGHKEIN